VEEMSLLVCMFVRLVLN